MKRNRRHFCKFKMSIVCWKTKQNENRHYPLSPCFLLLSYFVSYSITRMQNHAHYLFISFIFAKSRTYGVLWKHKVDFWMTNSMNSGLRYGITSIPSDLSRICKKGIYFPCLILITRSVTIFSSPLPLPSQKISHKPQQFQKKEVATLMTVKNVCAGNSDTIVRIPLYFTYTAIFLSKTQADEKPKCHETTALLVCPYAATRYAALLVKSNHTSAFRSQVIAVIPHAFHAY